MNALSLSTEEAYGIIYDRIMAERARKRCGQGKRGKAKENEK